VQRKQTLTSHTLHGTDMKKQSFIAAVLLLLSIQANAVVISLEGEEADGAAFNILTLNNTDTREVLDINFNFNYEAFDPSWSTDLVVEVAHITSGTFYQIGTQAFGCADLGVLCDFDLAWIDVSGVFSAVGTISLAIDTIVNGAGDWEVLIADTFNDAGVDGVFLAGSFVEITQGTRVISANSPVGTLFIVLAGLALLVRKKLL
jgi:hypothetical protein